jgi:hypothetical protein
MSEIRVGDRVERRTGASPRGAVVRVWPCPLGRGTRDRRWRPCVTVQWENSSRRPEILCLAELRKVEE